MFITEKNETGITIKKYKGKDSVVKIPKQIDGSDVTQIGDEAFRDCEFILDVKIPETVTYLGNYAFCQCRGLEEVVLPKSLVTAGSHCFYNCRNIVKMDVPCGLKYIGDGFIKNCEKICVIKIDCHKNISGGVVAFLNELKSDFCLEIEDINTKLVFPGYDFEYVSINAAKIFKTVTHGAGYKYRLAVETRGIRFIEYDSFFIRAIASEKVETCLNIAFTRLKTPFMLSQQSKENYLKFISDNICDAVIYCSKNEDISAMEIMKNNSVITSQNIDEVVDTAAKQCNCQLSAYILDLRLSGIKPKEKNFEL